MKYLLSIVLLILIWAPLTAQSNDSSEEAAVLKVVDLFFESMSKQDTAVARAIMAADGQYYALSDVSNDPNITARSNRSYIENLTARKDLIQERMWDPTVLIHKRIATVWAPYDIHINGEFLHCGVDCFSLIKTAQGWKIASIIFTMEPKGCDPSPLGPIK